MSDKEKDKKEPRKKVSASKKLKEEIKKMEAKKREAIADKAKVEAKADKKCSFDEWYAGRASRIPAVHRKEILRADFAGRGLKGQATMEDWDEALKKYGVELKK